MKSREEIEDQIKIYEEIKKQANVFTSEFTLACGALIALAWVLED